MVKGSHHVSLFTVSRHDLHDFQRCPKILAIKTYLMMKEPEQEPEPLAQPERTTPTPQAIGKVGEVATRVALAEEVPEEQKQAVAVSALEKLGLVVDEWLKEILAESLGGLSQVRPALESEYGEINIIGKGETRYGLAPTYGLPDYVAFAKGKAKPILVEVKNSLHQSSADEFQASYYNTLQKTVGVVVTKERKEAGVEGLRPMTIFEQDAETVIIYPRLGDYVPIKDTTEISRELIQSVWEAKQLGLVGKSPSRNCPAKCPHRRFGVELQEGALEPAKPLSLIFAKGLMDVGVDLDLRGMRDYVAQRAWPLIDAAWRLKDGGSKEEKLELIGILASKFDLTESEAALVLFRGDIRLMANPAEVVKEMASDLEPWESLVGAEEATSLGVKAYSVATRIYNLPESSAKLVDKSWKTWGGS